MLHVGRKVKNKKLEDALPALYTGDRLTQREFHRRYEAYPDDTKFELIGGIVYMASPAGLDHGSNDFDVAGALMVYRAATPGVLGAGNVTVILGKNSEPQPDLVLFINPERGGQAKIERRGRKRKRYLVGGPELVIEIAHSSVALDLHFKREDYRAGGVREYIVVCIEEQQIRWFDLFADRELDVPEDAVVRSFSFPGLWLNSRAIFLYDAAQLLATVNEGVRTPEHKQFVAKLAASAKNLARKSTKKPSRRK